MSDNVAEVAADRDAHAPVLQAAVDWQEAVGSLRHFCQGNAHMLGLLKKVEEKTNAVRSVDGQGPGGMTPLISACYDGRLEDAQRLVAFGAGNLKNGNSSGPAAFIVQMVWQQ